MSLKDGLRIRTSSWGCCERLSGVDSFNCSDVSSVISPSLGSCQNASSLRCILLAGSTCCFPATTQELVVQQHVRLGSHNEIDHSLSSQREHLGRKAALEDCEQMKLQFEED